MSIHLGPVDGVTVHLATAGAGLAAMPAFLCTDGGDRLQVRHVHTWTSDLNVVTCSNCIEWMHA